MRKSNQWFIHCLLPHRPHQLSHALGATGAEVDKASVYGCLDVTLVWTQLKRSDLVKVARLYKQGGSCGEQEATAVRMHLFVDSHV